MSRYDGMPRDYHPLLLCDLREAPEGGAVRAPGVVRASLDQLARRRCAFMVHGFNNHAGEAARAYNGFRVQQLARVPGLSELALDRRLADVHWPGDAEWWGPLDPLDFLVYPEAVAHARESAAQLAALIAHALPALDVVDFVGHSLGCRVILETLQRMADDDTPVHVGRVVLMAAAVPADFLEPGGASMN
jgi:pimeloyl-ACP methyl ester carboxylesterase